MQVSTFVLAAAIAGAIQPVFLSQDGNGGAAISESFAKKATAKCNEIRAQADRELLRFKGVIESRFRDLDTWVEGKGGWSQLNSREWLQVRFRMELIATTALQGASETLNRAFEEAIVGAERFGPAALLGVGQAGRMSPDITFAFPVRVPIEERIAAGWIGNWEGVWEQTLPETLRRRFILTLKSDAILEKIQVVSGTVEGEDGINASVSGNIVACDEAYEFGFMRQYTGVNGNVGVVVDTGRLIRDPTHPKRFMNQVSGIWVASNGFGTWRMWPVK